MTKYKLIELIVKNDLEESQLETLADCIRAIAWSEAMKDSVSAHVRELLYHPFSGYESGEPHD